MGLGGKKHCLTLGLVWWPQDSKVVMLGRRGQNMQRILG